MQLLITDCEQIALKIQDAILHAHGEKDEGGRDNNKGNKEQSKWQFWAQCNSHCYNNWQDDLLLYFIFQSLLTCN